MTDLQRAESLLSCGLVDSIRLDPPDTRALLAELRRLRKIEKAARALHEEYLDLQTEPLGVVLGAALEVDDEAE